MTITAKERSMLIKIRDCEFHDGRNPVNSPVWLNCIAESKSDGGVLTSLQTKGFVIVTVYRSQNDPDNVVEITQAGFDALAG